MSILLRVERQTNQKVNHGSQNTIIYCQNDKGDKHSTEPTSQGVGGARNMHQPYSFVSLLCN